MDNSLAQQGYNQAEYETAITTYLKQEQKGVTVQDVVVGTGLNTEWTEYTLRQLLGKFPAHLEINTKQELLYLFDLTPKPLPVGKYIVAGISWIFWAIWQVFTFAFKVWIVAMLCTYALVYALILVVVVVAITRSGEILEGVFHGIWYGLGELWNIITGKQKVQTNEADKRFLNDIFSYVFGATPLKKDKRATEKLILQHIRANEGKLVPADIVKLTGWGLRDAQEQAAYLLANYRGEVSVNDEGKIVYYFPELVKEEGTIALPAPIWEQPFNMPRMNDADKDTHNIITGVNVFNIIMSIATPIIFLFAFPETNNVPDWILIWFTMIPFSFSFIFFLVPSVRYVLVQRQKEKAKKQQIRLRILRKVFEKLPNNVVIPLNAKELGYAAQTSDTNATAVLEKLQIEMNAEAIATSEGVAYDFKDFK